MNFPATGKAPVGACALLENQTIQSHSKQDFSHSGLRESEFFKMKAGE